MNIVKKWLAQKHRAATLPQVKVTKEEFVRRLVDEMGEEQSKAEQMATVAESLGSRIEINNEMVGIKTKYDELEESINGQD
jgi:hypothetical protein